METQEYIEIIRGVSNTHVFALQDIASAQGNNLSGHSFNAGDIQISLGGIPFGNTVNLPTEIGASGVYEWVLDASESIAIGIISVIIADSVGSAWKTINFFLLTIFLFSDGIR